jgi:hypothetical protein
MITIPPITNPKELVLKTIAQPIKTCAICLKPADCITASFCAGCLYPYNNQQAFSPFDYFDYLQYSEVNSIKAQEFFIKTAVLNPCTFCGGDALFQKNSLVSIYERYYPAFENTPVKYKDTLRSEVFYIGCNGCTFATEYLYLYQFYAFYGYLIEAWNNGESRLQLIKYCDLRLPDWAINYQLLKTLKKYAAQYLQNLQQSLFTPAQLLSKQQRAGITHI